uniref:CARD domain-containing protein n=1 Tax=Plectus sambesii TaxID=2011161 RepID=A0A914V482_9BILA
MELADKNRITSHRDEIVNNMRVDTVIDKLISSGTLNDHDENEIKEKPNSKEKNRELLRILIGKPNSFNKFIAALRGTQQYELANMLQNEGVATDAPAVVALHNTASNNLTENQAKSGLTNAELISKFENSSEKAIEDSLTRSLQAIVDSLDSKEVLIFLEKAGHLRRANRESIMAGSTYLEQHVNLVDHVKKGGKERCIVFIKALVETEQIRLVRSIADKIP